MELFDTHCHLDLPRFDVDREEILNRCRNIGINHIVVPAIEQSGWSGLLALCAVHDGMLHAALGLHPMFVERLEESHLSLLEEAVREHHPVAIGEIGLDYHSGRQSRERQLALFDAQLEIAARAGLPLILHVRKAHDEVLERLRRHRIPGGVVHAFNGSLQQARRYLELGFRFGFGGAVTRPAARRLHRLVRELPLEALLLETDAPDMPPESHRGERNRPDYLVEILDAVARLRDEDPALIAQRTSASARELFGIPGRAGKRR